jgi:hypothetical protein
LHVSRPWRALPRPCVSTQLARRCRRAHGRNELAAALLLEFDQGFPGSAAQAEASYLAAQLLHEDFGEPEEARKPFDSVVRTCPRDPLAIAAKRYLQAMDGAVRR